MIEEWKAIPGWEGMYEASDLGRIRSHDRQCNTGREGVALRRGRILVPVAKQQRYLAVTLADCERREQHLVHILILRTFRGEAPEGCIGCHEDDDKANNLLSNLYWGTYQSNAADKIKNGNGVEGERHPLAKLTEDQVYHIRASSETGPALARKYGVTAPHIWAVRHRRCWRHI
jgi:hypothetical protein